MSFAEEQTLLRMSIKSGMDYKKTSVERANFVRDLCKMYVHDVWTDAKLTGVLEIDESLFVRTVKYHKGNPKGRNKIWILGLIARESGTLLLFPVDKRDSKTLLVIIEKHVEKRSTIYSDGWATYNTLNDIGYKPLYCITQIKCQQNVCKRRNKINHISGHKLDRGCLVTRQKAFQTHSWHIHFQFWGPSFWNNVEIAPQEF